MKALLTISVLAHAVSVHAQSWCAPGATWNYAINGMFIQGNTLYSFEGDTVLDGYSAQKIRRQERLLSWWNDLEIPDTLDQVSWRYTAVVDSVLLLRNLPGTYWDTLHVFNSVVGSRWWPPFTDGFCDAGSTGMLEVVDISTVTHDGIALRSWTMDFVGFEDELLGWGVNFTERLGPQYGFEMLPWSCIISEMGEALRCYHDDEMEVVLANDLIGCLSMTGFDEVWGTRIAVHPNPGTDRFTLDLPPGAHAVDVYDITGRSIQHTAVMADIPVDASAWLPGTYLLRLPELGRSFRWVKQ